MCNDYGNKIPYSEYLAAFSEIRIPVKWPNAAPNLEPRDEIWPTDRELCRSRAPRRGAGQHRITNPQTRIASARFSSARTMHGTSSTPAFVLRRSLSEGNFSDL
jgi:hypothetical protein